MNSLYFLGELHGIIILILAVIILYTDHKGFQYFTGKVETLPERFVRRSHLLVFTGLILMIVTGIILTVPAWEYRLSDPTFYIKMGFVLVLIMNSFAIGQLSKKSTSTPFSELTSGEKQTLMVSGALSAAGWVGAAIIGIFFL